MTTNNFCSDIGVQSVLHLSLKKTMVAIVGLSEEKQEASQINSNYSFFGQTDWTALDKKLVQPSLRSVSDHDGLLVGRVHFQSLI